MKKLIKQLELVQSELEAQILDREELFNNRSEKWQESERGELFEEKSDLIQEMFDQISDYPEQLQSE